MSAAAPGRHGTLRAAASLALLAAVGAVVVDGQPRAQAARIERPPPVDIGSAESFAVLAAATVTNSGASHIVGDLGVSPGTAVTGFPPGTLDGTFHNGDPVAAQAQTGVTAGTYSATITHSVVQGEGAGRRRLDRTTRRHRFRARAFGITLGFFCCRCGFEGLLPGGRLCERRSRTDQFTVARNDGAGNVSAFFETPIRP